jgi:hypothetical protein
LKRYNTEFFYFLLKRKRVKMCEKCEKEECAQGKCDCNCTCDDVITKWLTDFKKDIEGLFWQFSKEISKSRFSDWRISYGIQENIAFLAFYPAFSNMPKIVLHYPNIKDLAKEVIAIESLVKAAIRKDIDMGSIQEYYCDVCACLVALYNGKESFELCPEQIELTDLGLRHYHLDSFYQEKIRKLCLSFYNDNTLFGVEKDQIKISFLSTPIKNKGE